jgi:hypothetical protein
MGEFCHAANISGTICATLTRRMTRGAIAELRRIIGV